MNNDNRYVKFVEHEHRNFTTIQSPPPPAFPQRRQGLGFTGCLGVLVISLVAVWSLKGCIVNAAEPRFLLVECPSASFGPCFPAGDPQRPPHIYLGKTACLLDLASSTNSAVPGTRFSCEEIEQ